MKKLELSGFGVQEMDAKEMNKIDGGVAPWWAIGVAIYLYDNKERFIEGVKKGLSDFN